MLRHDVSLREKNHVLRRVKDCFAARLQRLDRGARSSTAAAFRSVILILVSQTTSCFRHWFQRPWDLGIRSLMNTKISSWHTCVKQYSLEASLSLHRSIAVNFLAHIRGPAQDGWEIPILIVGQQCEAPRWWRWRWPTFEWNLINASIRYFFRSSSTACNALPYFMIDRHKTRDNRSEVRIITN